MKSQKGVTLISLVAYIAIFMIIISIMTVISSHLYKNIIIIQEPLKYVTEFNKFSMVFVQDVKNNKSCTVTDTTVEFADGTTYSYTKKAIYRNGVKIAKNIENLKFKSSTYTVNTFVKNIVNIDMTLGKGEKQVKRNIDFVLKYW